jgi:hypothetical protein
MERNNMSLKGWLLSLGAVLIVYIVFLVREIEQAAKGKFAVGLLVFVDVLLKPRFWLIALPVFGLVFWVAFKRAPGPH